MNEQVDVWMDGWMNVRMDGWMDELMNGKSIAWREPPLYLYVNKRVLYLSWKFKRTSNRLSVRLFCWV